MGILNLQKNASKSIHATVVKYVTAELAKCNFDEKILEGTFDCSDKTLPSTSAGAISHVLGKLWGQDLKSKIKHLMDLFCLFSRTPGYYNRVTCNTMWEYNTLMENTSSEITVYTCPSDVAAEKITTRIPIE